MSDDERDVDIESDDDIDSDFGTLAVPQRQTSGLNSSQVRKDNEAEKRAHHNALERKRRDHIKESFTNLREAVPTLKGEKASRAQILKKTTECIVNMKRKIQANQKDVEDIRRQNAKLEAQIRALEKAKNGYPLDPIEFQRISQSEQALLHDDGVDTSDGDNDDEDVFSPGVSNDFNRRNKKMKTSYQV